MPHYAYKARPMGEGMVCEGVLEAPDPKAAVSRLRAKQLVALEVREATETALARLRRWMSRGGGVSSREVAFFSRQLATLVSSGVALVPGLGIVRRQVRNPAFRSVLGGIIQDIEAGFPIAEALSKRPGVFPPLYVALVRAGEQGGMLDVILERLTLYLESTEALRAKVRSAMTYPAALTAVSAAVTLFLLAFVIPTFREIFAGFGGELPLPTRMVLACSEWLLGSWFLVLGAVAAALAGTAAWARTEAGRTRLDALRLRLPLFGPLLLLAASARFARTLGTMVKSGVPILQALETVAAAAGNRTLERAILAARASVGEGERISEPLERAGVFPPLIVQMIAVGEETGNLDVMLAKVADYYEQEVDTAVKGLTSLVEPVLIVILGVVIGGMVVSMFLPILSLPEQVGR